jgi:hypothetical protein
MKVSVSREVLEGIEAVRLSGVTNMLDRHAGAYHAETMGYTDAARWLRENPSLYAKGVFVGFEVTP